MLLLLLQDHTVRTTGPGTRLPHYALPASAALSGLGKRETVTRYPKRLLLGDENPGSQKAGPLQ